MRTFGRKTMATVAVMAAWASTAAGEEVKLIFATTNAPTAHLNVRIMHPWAQRINEQGKGVVRIDVRDGPTLANHTNFYSRVLDDVVQVSWGIQTYLAGKFQRSLVVTLPFVSDKSEEASVAYWRLYKSGVVDAEYDEIVPLFLVSFPQLGLHTAKALKSLDNLKGLKFAVGSKVVSDVVARLGGTPISLPITDYYEAVHRGTVDGAAVQWSAFQPFKLAEVTRYHVETQLGGTAGMVFMAKKKYDALPAAARKIIDANSGEAQSRRFGAFWDNVHDEGRATVKATGKHTLVTLTPEQGAKWRHLLGPITTEWAKNTPDGAQVLAAFNELLAAVKAGK